MKNETRADKYDASFFDKRAGTVLNSANAVIPVLIEFYKPHSVVDVGCGIGVWLSAWEKFGVNDILGIDGNYIDRNQLRISPDKFLAADLENKIEIGKKFDLAMSLEVAEHISPSAAKYFVATLCNLSDLVLFSAAIPGQPGVLHVNEQYPQYWVDHFTSMGYSSYDVLRERIWLNTAINAYYRQNMMFFVKDGSKNNYPAITGKQKKVLPLVHPDYLEEKQFQLEQYKKALRTPFHAIWYFMKCYGKKLLGKKTDH